jgi:hypothetical protein
MEKQTKPKCTICNKALVAIGSSRLNGKTHKDWSSRKMHKKCWYENQNILKVEKYILNMK